MLQTIKMANNYYARLNHNVGVRPCRHYITLYTVQANYILLYTQQARKLAEGLITIHTKGIANVPPTKCTLQMQASEGGSKS